MPRTFAQRAEALPPSQQAFEESAAARLRALVQRQTDFVERFDPQVQLVRDPIAGYHVFIDRGAEATSPAEEFAASRDAVFAALKTEKFGSILLRSSGDPYHPSRDMTDRKLTFRNAAELATALNAAAPRLAPLTAPVRTLGH